MAGHLLKVYGDVPCKGTAPPASVTSVAIFEALLKAMLVIESQPLSSDLQKRVSSLQSSLKKLAREKEEEVSQLRAQLEAVRERERDLGYCLEAAHGRERDLESRLKVSQGKQRDLESCLEVVREDTTVRDTATTRKLLVEVDPSFGDDEEMLEKWVAYASDLYSYALAPELSSPAKPSPERDLKSRLEFAQGRMWDLESRLKVVREDAAARYSHQEASRRG